MVLVCHGQRIHVWRDEIYETVQQARYWFWGSVQVYKIVNGLNKCTKWIELAKISTLSWRKL